MSLDGDYVPTEEEKRVFKECRQESLLYRALPCSLANMFLAASRWHASLPKVAFAGLCGYVAGKISYIGTCREKFMKLENSPLGEALRQHPNTRRSFDPETPTEPDRRQVPKKPGKINDYGDEVWEE